MRPAHQFSLDADVSLTITIRNPDATERVTGAGGDDWRSMFYNLRTVDDVLEHFAHNAILNGITDVSRLEGWADLAADAVVIALEVNSVDTIDGRLTT